jgi:starch-binding outer membrane protein, SusD/RagB family
MKKTYIWLFLFLPFIAGCDLEEIPVSTTTKHAVFSSESGLQLYSTSFYDWLPSANNIHQNDYVSDYSARRNVPGFIRPGVYSSSYTDDTSASGYERVTLGSDWNWGWSSLRNFNFFLANNTDPSIPLEVRQHYNGLARFFRAWFYFEKVKRYGDVPWINKPLDVEDPKLWEGRDPRTLVMDSVLADINYAIAHIRPADDPSRTLVTRDVARALKSRICLFEGTFRKYHTGYGLQNTADSWLAESAAAAGEIMTGGRFSIYTGAGANSYRQLFISQNPIASEVIFAIVSDTDLGVRHAANWYLTSATTGVRFSFLRQFIHTYLNIDGTPFTSRPGYQTMTFMEEMKGRDRRLEQTIRGLNYTRLRGGVPEASPPTFSYTYTGYQPIKWVIDDVSVDGGNNNTNAVSVFRFAEVLLNYAEAKAELGTLTDAEWASTIGVLRSRAGITGGLDARPVAADPYLQSVYFPGISDPSLLEVRRERGIELALEGLRFHDIVRWRRGELYNMPWRGFYVPQANQYMDLNEDGTPDVYFHTAGAPANQTPGVMYVNVNDESMRLTGGNSGELEWRYNVAKAWDEKNYLYPVPETHLLTNPNLGQNPGW